MADAASNIAHKGMTGIAGLITGIIVVAIIAVLVGTRSTTPSFLSAAGGAVSSIVGAAVNTNPAAASSASPAVNPLSSTGVDSATGLPSSVANIGGGPGSTFAPSGYPAGWQSGGNLDNVALTGLGNFQGL